MKTFKQWILSEGKDIFGFKRQPEIKADDTEGENPLKPINADIIIEEMMKSEVGGIEPFSAYPDQIQWGVDTGAVRMVISPLGSFKSIIRKLHLNLLGEEVWVCKKVIPYRDMKHASEEYDERLAGTLLEDVVKSHKDPVSAPNDNYEGLERLVTRIYREATRANIMPNIFIPMGIRQVVKNKNYLMHFECRGHGVEAPNSGRLEAFLIDMSYDPKTGMIRSFGHDVQSKVKGHVWYPQPSEWDEYFSPSQPEEEIISCVADAFSTY